MTRIQKKLKMFSLFKITWYMGEEPLFEHFRVQNLDLSYFFLSHLS